MKAKNKKWTVEDDKLIIRHYTTPFIMQKLNMALADQLGVSLHTLQQRQYYLTNLKGRKNLR
jgi:hypothetical protein